MRLRPSFGGVLVAVLLAAPAIGKERVVRVKLGPFDIPAKRDREVCHAVRVRGVAGKEVARWEARSRVSRGGAVGSHHLVLYGYQGRDSRAFPDGLIDDSAGCAGFGPSDFFSGRVFLAGSGGEFQRGHWTVTEGSMPGDLAQVIPGSEDAPDDAVVVINSHYFNGSAGNGKGLVKLRLTLVPLDPRKRVVRQVIHVDASREIKVAPGSVGPPVEATWQADGAPNPSTEGGANPAGDVCVLNLTSHMHKRGTLFTMDYEEGGRRVPLLSWTDYVHPGLVLFPPLGPGPSPLLRAYTAANGFPRIRYGCTHANGAEGREMKLGCQAEAGVTPGLSWSEAEPRGISSLTSHAEPCGKDGVACGGRPCVPANLVFGPLSDDDMCVLTATVYDPIPGADPAHACDIDYGY